MNKKEFLSKGSIAGAILLSAAAIGFVSLNREPAGPGNEGAPVIAQEAETLKPAEPKTILTDAKETPAEKPEPKEAPAAPALAKKPALKEKPAGPKVILTDAKETPAKKPAGPKEAPKAEPAEHKKPEPKEKPELPKPADNKKVEKPAADKKAEPAKKAADVQKIVPVSSKEQGPGYVNTKPEPDMEPAKAAALKEQGPGYEAPTPKPARRPGEK